MQWGLSKINDFSWLVHWFLMWGKCVKSRVPALSFMHLHTTWRNASQTGAGADLHKCSEAITGQAKGITMRLFLKKKSLMWRENFLQDLFCFVEAAVSQNYYPALNVAGLQVDFMSCKVWVNVSLLIRNCLILQDPFPAGSLGSKVKPLWMTVALPITCSCSYWRHRDRSKHKCYLEISVT